MGGQFVGLLGTLAPVRPIGDRGDQDTGYGMRFPPRQYRPLRPSGQHRPSWWGSFLETRFPDPTREPWCPRPLYAP